MTPPALLLTTLLLTPAPHPQDDDPPPPPPETGTLHVTVVDEDGEGVFKADVSAAPTAAEIEAARDEEGNSFLQPISARTDPDGYAALALPAGEARTLRVGKFRDSSIETVEVAALTPGEERELVVAVKTRADSELTGRVVAAEDGRPLAGVAVHVARTSGMGARAEPFVQRGAPAAVTDEEGLFRAPFASWTTEVATFTAAGRGPARLRLSGDGGPDLAVRLQEAARLTGLFTGEVPRGARVEAQASGFHLFEDSSNAVGLGADVAFVAPVDASGAFELDDLPPGVPMSLRLVAGREVLVQEASKRVLRPGELLEVEWSPATKGLVRGRVVDAAGAPVAGMTVWLLPREESYPGLLRSYQRPTERAVSDEAGRFSFDGVYPGSWTVGLAPAERGVGLEDAHAPVSLGVEVDPEAGDAEVVLTVIRGLAIAGRVLDPEGQPIRAHVSAWGGGSVSEGTQANGEFRLGPLPRGEYRLSATPALRHETPFLAEAEPLSVAAGRDDVVLRLRRGGSLAGVVMDDGTGARVAAHVRLLYTDRVGSMRGGGAIEEFEYTCLLPGRYHLHATTDDGRVGFLTDLEVEADVARRRLEVFLVPAGFLRVAYEGPQEYGNYDVEIGGARLKSDGLRSGTTARVTVPPGEVTVSFRVHDRGSDERPPPIVFDGRRAVTVTAGEEVEVRFDLEEEDGGR